MSAGALVFEVLVAFILAASILYRYGDWYRHHIFVTLSVLLAWYFSFLIIFVLPLDVSSTVYRKCLEDNPETNINGTNSACEEPWSHVGEDVLPELWRVVYWTSQLLTWIIMPMMQSYIKAGDFTVKGKLKSALIDNAIYYGSYLFICGILLIYIALKPGVDLDWQKLKAIASSASNTWGLFLLVLLLGYALVEVPRSLWFCSKHSYVLSRSYFKVAKLSSEKAEAEETVDDVLESLKAVSLAIRPGHPLHPNLETILQKIPAELQDRMNRRQLPDDTPTDVPSEKALVRLHSQAIKSLQTLQRTETQWNVLVEYIFELEDTIKNVTSRDRKFKHTFEKSDSSVYRFFYNPTFEWYWRCFVHSHLQKTLAVTACILSFAVVWSELTFFNKEPVLSLFALFVKVARYDYGTIEVLSTFFIAYLCYCAYSTVLKIKVLNIYYLAPHHQTNEYSLIFSGMMLSRLTPPLCLNFLGLIHMDSHIITKQVLETHYTQIMGHMDVISIISDGFNIYFPMMIIAFCLATYFSLGSRLLSALGFQQFVGDDELTADLVDEGRELIKREKRKRQRAEESMVRRREFQERFHTSTRQPSQRDPGMDSSPEGPNARSNLLKGDDRPETYSGLGDLDTRLPGNIDSLEDIDARFGSSTRTTVDVFAAREPPEPRFAPRGMPPRGIFDDV